MEFIQGINFHSATGYKYLISGDYRSTDLDIDTHIAELLSAQKYSYFLQPGQKFYFVYPHRTPKGNKQVFGSGEIVRSKQQGRETILVPFVHYFALSLSDAVKYGMDFDAFFKANGISYEKIFSESLTNSNLPVDPLSVKTNEESDNNVSSESPELQECLGSRGSKIKRYVPTLEDGLNILNSLMHSPNTVRWAYSAILTPLDEEYPENIVIIYGQQAKYPSNSATSNYLLPLRLANQQVLLNQFIRYIASKKQQDLKTATIDLLDSQSLEELEEMVKKFVKEDYAKTKEMGDGIINSHSKIKGIIQELVTKSNPTAQDLAKIDSLLNDHETGLRKYWSDPTLANQYDFSDEDLYNSLAGFTAQTLQNLLDGTGIVKISNARLKKVMDRKTQDSKNIVANYWSNEFARLYPNLVASGTVRVFQSNNLSVEQCIARSGIDQFISIGVKKTTELFYSQNFDKAVQCLKVFTNRVSTLVAKQTMDENVRAALITQGIAALQEILSKLQEPLDKTAEPSAPYSKTEEALVITIKDYLTIIMQNDKKPNNSTDNNYFKALNTLKALLDATDKKHKKWLDEKQKKEQEALKSDQKKLEEQYNALKDMVNSKKKRPFLPLNSF